MDSKITIQTGLLYRGRLKTTSLVKTLAALLAVYVAARLTLRNESVDHRNPADEGLDDPEIFVVRAFMQPVNHSFRWRAGQRGDAVIGLHPAKGRVVSGVANCIDGKILILDLGFL